MSSTQAHLRVTIISVCYNSMAVLPAMLASVPAGTPVVLVDNSPAADPALADLARKHGARLIRNEANLGFGVACNIGARDAGTEFLLFLNPDATLAPDALDHLVAAMARYPAASAANPRIGEADGRPYFKRRSVLIPRSEWMPRGWPAADREVSVLSGAAFFVRRAAFEAVGGFDPQILLYHEDDDLGRRLRAMSGPLLFVRDALITHVAGSSTERTAATAEIKALHMGRSRVYSMRRHGVPFAFARSLAVAILQLALPSNWLSIRRRVKSAAFLRGVLDGRHVLANPLHLYRRGNISDSLPPRWKVWREVKRLVRQLRASPREAAAYLFATPYHDLVLVRHRRITEGRIEFGPRIAVILIFPSEGLEPSHLTMLRYFQSRGYASVVVSNLPMSPSDQAKVLPLCARYIERKNFGYDFGGYRDGVLSVAARLAGCERMVLVNDSSWFPLPGSRDWLSDAEALKRDYVGASTHYCAPRPEPEDFRAMRWTYRTDSQNFHYGSFALSIGNKILRDAEFLEFWRRFRLTNVKTRVVRRGETGLTRWVLNKGYSHGETLGVEKLDQDLDRLSTSELRRVAENLILPFDKPMRDIKRKALSDPTLGRTDTIALILTAVARQGASYALCDYAIRHKGFAFLKKAPCRADPESSAITLAITGQFPAPQGPEIRSEGEKLRRKASWAREPAPLTPAALHTADTAAPSGNSRTSPSHPHR